MIHISAVSLHSSDAYQLHLSDNVTIELLARYLAQSHTQEDEYRTLEMARPILPRHRIDEMDIQAGDRLLVLEGEIRQSIFPEILTGNKKSLTFSAGDYQVQSRGKRHLHLGKPDAPRGVSPDIDARFFIAPQLIDFISRSCLRFDFDPVTEKWYALKVGVNRVLMDDYEIKGSPVPVEGDCRLTFYRASDEPLSTNAQSLGELSLSVAETPTQSRKNYVELEAGDYPVSVVVGAEKENQHLNISSSVSAETIAGRLAQHDNTSFAADYHLYVLRLVTPRIALAAVHLGDDQFLYFGTRANYTQNVLILRYGLQREVASVLHAGEDKLVGYRERMETFDPVLNVDLYDLLVQAQIDPAALEPGARYLAWLSCRASDNSWWILTATFSSVAIYLNNRRLSAGENVQLFTGDVLTFSAGPLMTFEHYFARFEVELSTRAFDSPQHTNIG